MRNKNKFWFSGIPVLFSLVFAGFVNAETATPGAESPEKLGIAVFEALKTASLEGYMKFVRTEEDEEEIIKKLPLDDERKARAINDKQWERRWMYSFAEDAFQKVLDNIAQNSIVWDRAVFKKVIAEKEPAINEMGEGNYNIIFSDGNSDYAISMLQAVQTKRGYVFVCLYDRVKPFSGEGSGTLGSLIKELIKSDICKEYIVNIKGMRSAMKLSGDGNNPEGLQLINEQRAHATATVMMTLNQLGKLKEEDRGQVQRLVMEILDAESAP